MKLPNCLPPQFPTTYLQYTHHSTPNFALSPSMRLYIPLLTQMLFWDILSSGIDANLYSTGHKKVKVTYRNSSIPREYHVCTSSELKVNHEQTAVCGAVWCCTVMCVSRKFVYSRTWQPIIISPCIASSQAKRICLPSEHV